MFQNTLDEPYRTHVLPHSHTHTHTQISSYRNALKLFFNHKQKKTYTIFINNCACIFACGQDSFKTHREQNMSELCNVQ